MRRRWLRVGLAVGCRRARHGRGCAGVRRRARRSTTKPSTTTPPTPARHHRARHDCARHGCARRRGTRPDCTRPRPARRPPPLDAPAALVDPSLTVTPSTEPGPPADRHHLRHRLHTERVRRLRRVQEQQLRRRRRLRHEPTPGSRRQHRSGLPRVRRPPHPAHAERRRRLAAAPGTCNIGAAKISDYAEQHGAPLTFDPNTPLLHRLHAARGTMSGLVEGDSVALFGGGFVPNSPVAIVQCSQPTTASCR